MVCTGQIQIERQVISTNVGNVETSQFIIDWTTGETFIKSLKSQSYILTQGIHQADPAQTTDVTNTFLEVASIQVWPNPTAGEIHMDIELTNRGLYAISLTDVSGKKITSTPKALFSGSNHLSFDLWKYPSGMYILTMEELTSGHTESYAIRKM